MFSGAQLQSQELVVEHGVRADKLGLSSASVVVELRERPALRPVFGINPDRERTTALREIANLTGAA